MRFLFALVLMTTFSVPLVAAEAPGGSRSSVCREDIQKYCAQVEPGEGRLAHCMRENVSKFSPACQADMQKHEQTATKKRDELRASCKGDAEKFCKDKADGRGGVMHCLRAHKKQLSEDCRKSLPQRTPGGQKEGGKTAG